MNNIIPFTTIKELNSLIKNRKVVLFGAGNIAEKTARIIDQKKIAFITDNASNLWGDKQINLIVKNPSNLKKFNRIILSSNIVF